MSETFKTFFYGFLLAVGVCLMLSCNVTRKLDKHSEATSEKTDTTATRAARTRSNVSLRVDSTGTSFEAGTAKETAQNETVEETETTTYDTASGKVASVTKTRRRSIGNTAKESQSSAKHEAAVSRDAATKTDVSVTEAFAGHSELKHETKDKQAEKVSKPAVGAWLKIGGVILVVGALVWFFVPKLAAYGSGGPIGLLLAVARRKREQRTA